MLKIVHFGKYYFPDVGGIESVTAILAQGAAKANCDVKVVCFNKALAASNVRIEGVNVMRASISRMVNSQPISWQYIRFCLAASRDADIVHVHTPNLIAAICCLLISPRQKLLVHWHSDVLDKGVLGWLIKPLEFAMLRRANRIVVATQAYANASASLKPFLSKTSVSTYGIAEVKRLSFRSEVLAKLPQELAARVIGKRVVLGVGRLVRYKGFDILIEAAKHLASDVVVVIVGDGPLQSDLLLAIRSAGVAERVYLAGRLDSEELQAVFSYADLYCLPSIARSEAFGIVLLEAMAYSLPIVASDLAGSGVPWVNKHGVSGINVPTNDPIAFADACNKILNDESLRLQYSKGARDRFLSIFTENDSVQHMLSIYDDMSKCPNH